MTTPPTYLDAIGYWRIASYDHAATLLRDPRLGPGRGVPDSFGLSQGPLRDVMETWMMALDGHEHARARRLISRAFTPSAVERLRPAVTSTAATLVDDFVARGGGDVVSEIAFPLPMEVVRVLFGVDVDSWQREVVATFDPRCDDGTFLDQLAVLTSFFERFVPARRGDLGDDMFSALCAADEDGARLSDAELVANAVLLVTAGFETTMGFIAVAVLTLLRHPEQLALLRSDHGLIPQAIDEVLRYEPAALSTTRSATVEIEVDGITIPAAGNILFDLAAVNRDPERFRDPDVFDITRTDSRPLTFGGGAHLCLGAALARLEVEVVLERLLRRAAAWTLDEADIEWQTDNPTVRRPVRLRISTSGGT